MPYRWTSPAPETRVLTLWPHRSLTARGFVWFVGMTAALFLLPLLGVVGSPVLWALLPFLVAAIAGIWWAIRRNGRDGNLTEVLTITRDNTTLIRTEPSGARKDWKANPYWVRVTLHTTGGPVENYLTLKGGDREIEIGAFLSPDERLALRGELHEALAALP
jgi:uncharacterized membrane protein